MRVTQPRADSSKVSDKTVHLRSLELSHHRYFTSRGESSRQLSAEFKSCTRDKRQAILNELQGSSFKISVSPEQSLAMKSDLGIPWAKLRVIRR